MNHPRLLYGTVCDDIRREAGNKISLMGIYSGSIIIPQFPARLSKLCFALTARTSSTDPFQSLSFKVIKEVDGLEPEEMVKVDLTPEMLSKTAAGALANEDEIFMICGTMMTVSPFELDAPCTLKLRAQTEREELRGGSIKILQGEVRGF